MTYFSRILCVAALLLSACTDQKNSLHSSGHPPHWMEGFGHERNFCPPGQRKKDWCYPDEL